MTKLHPPPRRDQTVARGRLVDRLSPTPGIKLTLVAAPAGCGKTTLLGMWRDLEEASRPVAWLSLDEGDNDPVVLWSYVIAALRGVCPTLGVPVPPERVGSARIVDVVLLNRGSVSVRSPSDAPGSTPVMRERPVEDATYRLVVRGELDPRFAYLFNGLRMERVKGRTVISGNVIDQAQLHGYIQRIEELGLELLTVEQVNEAR